LYRIYILKGNCREAVEFYADVFKTEKPQIMSYGDTPQQPRQEFPQFEEMKDLVMHTGLNINGSNVMF
jgi:PhnB protein